ncbi:hypothetical protein GALL_497390 [mine drainage metagenome]|uniref:Uncharacterized protein n=1 Tax=mine drainage metagenome TaxID=410659 RepID=A0A1J5PTR2_9ZZZZ
MKSPIDAYVASGRRAAMSDTADTAVRRIARDVQRALPNSIRTSSTSCLEFIPTKTGGRYRTAETVAGDDTSLDFTKADSTFNMLGLNSAWPASQQMAAGDLIVVYNLGITGSDAYNADNSSAVTSLGTESAGETPINITAFKFPLASGTNRFQVISSTEKLVSYVCSGTNLFRTVSSSLSTTASCPATGSKVAANVDCTATNFNYSGSDLLRNALVSMALTLKDIPSGESVTLQHEVHVSNTP